MDLFLTFNYKGDKNMDNITERLNNIERRLVKLEKIEQRRKILSIIKFLTYLAVIIAIIVFGFYMYNRIIDTIEPYKEVVDKYNETKDVFNNFVK